MPDEELLPNSYRLPKLEQSLELSTTVQLLEMSCLGDFSLYSRRPDWFIKDPKSEKIDFDSRIGLRMIVEARRALRHNENAEELLEETLRAIAPNKKKLREAANALAKFMESATECIILRGTPNAKDERLMYYIEDVPNKLNDIKHLRGTIPESCIRACEAIAYTVIEPCPPQDTWEAAISSGSKRAVML